MRALYILKPVHILTMTIRRKAIVHNRETSRVSLALTVGVGEGEGRELFEELMPSTALRKEAVIVGCKWMTSSKRSKLGGSVQLADDNISN